MTILKITLATIMSCGSVSLAAGQDRVTTTGGGQSSGAASCVRPGTTGAQTVPTEASSADIAAALQEGGLMAVLSDMDMALALGLEFDQWLLAQFIISEFDRFTESMMMLDPEAQSTETMQAIEMLRFFIDFQLFLILTPEQREKISDLLQDGAGNTGSGTGVSGAASAGTVSGTTGGTVWRQ